MSSKLSPRTIIVEHFDTFYDHRDLTGSRRKSWTDYAVMIGVPVVVFAVFMLFDWRVQDFGQVLAGIAILTGFAFALIVFVFQLRLDLVERRAVHPGGVAARLVNELFTNVSYATLVGLATVVFLVAAGALGAPPDAPGALGLFTSSIAVFLGSHFFLTLVMCIKRLYTAYDRFARYE